MNTTRVRGFIEPLCLFGFGSFLLQLSRHRHAVETPLAVQAVELSRPLPHQLEFISGALLLLFAAGSYLLSRNGRSFTAAISEQVLFELRRLRQWSNALRTPRDASSWWLAGALLTGICLRIYFVDQPMRTDESYTFLKFINRDFTSLFNYALPNNHVLYTIMEKLSVLLVGSSPVGIRLPALVFGVALIPLTYGLSRRLNRESTGIFAALCVAVMPLLVLYSTNGRGYSLLSMFTLLIPYVLIADGGKLHVSRWALPALLSALGMLTIPLMLYALAGLSIWITVVLFLQTRSWREVLSRFLGPYIAATVLLTLIFYLPVVIVSGGFDSLTSNRFVQPLPAGAFWAGMMPYIGDTLADCARGVPVVAGVLLAALGALGLYAALRARQPSLLLLLPALLLGAALLLVLKRSLPFSRSWTYLIPFAFIAADAGFSHVCRALPPLGQKAAGAAVFAGAILFAFELAWHDSITANPDTGPVAGAIPAAQFLDVILSKDDVVCTELPVVNVVAYYLFRGISKQDYLSRPSNERLFFVSQVSPLQDAIPDLASGNAIFRSPEIDLYQWNTWDEAPNFVRKTICWSPAKVSGA